MINPVKMLKEYKDAKISSAEFEMSGDFILWAMSNGYDLFKLAFDKTEMDKCVIEYKKYMEGLKNENKSI